MRRGVGDSAERDDKADAEPVDRLEDARRRRLGQATCGSIAFEDDEVTTGTPSGANGAEDVLGPHDLALAVDVLDRRSSDREVEEPIRVDLPDDDAVRLVSDQAEGRRRHPGGVEPPAEGDEQHRIGQRRRVVDGQRQSVSHGLSESPWRPTRWSMQAVKATMSEVSIAGNMPTRIWLRPSLR